MSLILLEQDDESRTHIWLNPAHVLYLIAAGEDRTRVILRDGQNLLVHGNLAVVAADLSSD